MTFSKEDQDYINKLKEQRQQQQLQLSDEDRAYLEQRRITMQQPTAVKEEQPAEGGFFSDLAGAWRKSRDAAQGSGRWRRLPGFGPFGPVSLPESVVGEVGIRHPSYEELVTGAKKLGPEAMDAFTRTMRSVYGFSQIPEERKKMIEQGKQILGTLGKGTADIITGGKVSPDIGDTYRVTQPTSEGRTSEEAKVVRSIPGPILSKVGRTITDPGGEFKKEPLATLGVGRLTLGPADPAGLLFGLLGKTLTKTGKKFVEGMPARSGNVAGTGEEALREAQRIGREGDPARTKIFKEAQEDVPMLETMERVADAGAEVRKFKSDRFETDMNRVIKENINQKMDLPQVQTDMEDVLKGQKLFTSRDADGQLIIQAQPNTKWTGIEGQLDPVLKILRNADTWTDNSVEGLWELRRNIDMLRKSGDNFSFQGEIDAIAESVRGSVNKQLHKIGAFKKLDNDYSSAMNFVRQMEESLGIKRPRKGAAEGARIDEVELPVISKEQYTKVGNILNDRSSRNTELGKSIIDEMDKLIEKKTGIKGSLRAELSGQRLSREAAEGIRGKTGTPLIAAGAVSVPLLLQSGDVVTAASYGIGVGVMTMLRKMVIENPKSLGTFYRGLGATERKVKQITDFAQRILQSRPANIAKRGIAFGVLLDALSTEGNDRPDLLSTVGGIRPSFQPRPYYPGQ